MYQTFTMPSNRHLLAARRLTNAHQTGVVAGAPSCENSGLIDK